MARGKTLSVVFKANHQHQLMAFPPSLDELIASDHPVRVVHEVLEKVDITLLMKQYKPGGASSYHPRMLLKAVVYAYINNIYSSRRIEQALQESIYFMWLTGMSKPDHNTINRFRGQRLQKTLQPIFTQVVLLLCEEGLLSLKDLYTDGTKIEANANRYTFVWGKAIRSSKERIAQQLDELWKYAQSVAASEMDDTDPSGFKKIDKEIVQATVEKINTALKDKKVTARVRQKLNYARKHWPAALDKYEQQEKIMGTSWRSSYSKIDPDATFMRMKEDHMRNGQLKPGYNIQISTNSQYIASYSIHQSPNDTGTLIPHLKAHIKQLGKPNNITADAGYGSEQNYQWLENKRITAYVKYPYFDRHQSRKLSNKKPYTIDQFHYDEQKHRYYCPAGKPMKKIGSHVRTNKTRSGIAQTLTCYQAKNCAGCPLRQQCHPKQGDRIIEVNHNLNRLRQKADKRLKTKRGVQKRKQRCWDTEPVFGNIKHNHHFKRFMLRGIDKVLVETGLLALAHNLRKKVA